MASIERTAYPRFRKVVSARELFEAFTPTPEEMAWAREATRTEANLLALVALLKAFQRLGYFPRLSEVPSPVVAHVRRRLGLGDEVPADADSARTMERYRAMIREKVGVTYDPEAARKLAEEAITAAAQTKDNPADLINVALEELVKACYELPGYTTLDEMAARLRAEVNSGFFEGIEARVGPAGKAVLLGMLHVDASTRRSRFDELKRPARRPSLSRLKEHVEHLRALDATGDTAAWLSGVPSAKAAHFAGEARVLDASDLRKVGESKRVALLACLLHQARIRARDELAEMLCRRVAALHKRGREELAAIRERHRAETERLWGAFGQVLAGAREATGAGPEGEDSGGEVTAAVLERAGALMLGPLAAAGGVAKVSAEHADISAHHGNNYMPLLARHFRSHRSALFDLAEALELESTSADRSVLAALRFVRAQRHLTREFVDDRLAGEEPLDTSFCSQNWARTIRDRDRPGTFVRRHLEVCVFSYLAAELRSGDIAVIGADSYANFFDQLLSPAEVGPLIAGYCAEVDLPATAAEFRAEVEARLRRTAAEVDAGYPANADLVIDDAGRPVLKRQRGKDHPRSAVALAKAVEGRMHGGLPAVSATRTAHWIGWHRHFGPLSGSDPKLADPLGRYAVVTFTYGTNMGPYQMSRHPARRRQPARDLGPRQPARDRGQAQPGQRRRHRRVHGPRRGPALGGRLQGRRRRHTDRHLGRQPPGRDLDPLQPEYGRDRLPLHRRRLHRPVQPLHTSRRLGGGVHLRRPPGDASEVVVPEEIHADTQGQSLPAFGLALMLGVELLPRIRNWKDLIFYRAAAHDRYLHIDSLFGDDEVIDWKLIEAHFVDLMRVVISIREGRISSPALLRRLGNESRKNRIYKAFRELGRAVRTIVLLRYLSEPELRESITTITNRVESFHNFSKWLSFGNAGVIGDNDPDHMEKIVKFNELLANCVIFYNAAELTVVLNQLAAEGHPVRGEDVAALSPYATRHILRFGDYVLDLTPPTTQVSTHLELDAGDDPVEPSPA